MGQLSDIKVQVMGGRLVGRGEESALRDDRAGRKAL